MTTPTGTENSSAPSRYASHTSSPNASRIAHDMIASPPVPNGTATSDTAVSSGCGVGANGPV